VLEGGRRVASKVLFPCTWANLLRLKNLVQEHNPLSTIFPTASAPLGRSSLGIGARMTTLHWPAVEYAMAHLGLSVTANQNSIPRELVYSFAELERNTLDKVDFKFLGCAVPEGHQGQTVEGMSHGSVLSKLRTGFHRNGIPWGFNADHQPIGGKFDAREDALVAGSLLATYITFDLSPELAQQAASPTGAAARAFCEAQMPQRTLEVAMARCRELYAHTEPFPEPTYWDTFAYLWPSIAKMKKRDVKYAEARERAFTTPAGRAYFRELSIDELPGLTSKEVLLTI
jgi:hypothetical protein